MALHDDLLSLRPQLLAYARAICGTAADADDLVQDAMERAFHAKAPPRGLADLRPWMFRVMRNLHLDEQRKRKVRTEYAASHGRFPGSEAAAGDPLRDLLVRQAYESLSAQHREVLFLVDVMGMRYAEAAAILAVPEGTVMSRLSRARRAMLDHLDESNVAPLPQRSRK